MATETIVTTPPPLEGGGWGEGFAQHYAGDLGTVGTPAPNPLPQGEGEYRHQPPLSPLAPILLAAVPLLWPAVINGYPLVFSDTGTYLSQAVQHYLGWDRPIFYSLFLLALHLTLTTWPVIIAQALLASTTLHLLRRVLLPAVSVWWLVPLTATLAFATALPWLTAQLMPDLFTGLLVLTLGLLAFAASNLSRGERIWLTGFAACMIAVHQSHLPLVLLLLPSLLAMRWWLGPGTPGSSIAGSGIWRDTALLLAVPALACVALAGVNLIAYHRASVAPFSNVFSLARIIYDGPGMRVLQRDCPHMHWRLCPYLDAFPANADLFLWQPDSPLIRAGGAKLESTEANAIMARALMAEPGTELLAVLGNAAQQLGLFATGDGLEPWPQTVTPWIRRDFPGFEVDTYLAARQTNGGKLLPDWLGTLHRVVALLGVALYAALLPVTLLRRQRVGGFLALALLVLPINALITGGLSGPHDRYQSRVMWLPPLLAALAIVALVGPALTRRAAAFPSVGQQDPSERTQRALNATRKPRADTARSAKRLSLRALRALRALRWILLATDRAPHPHHPPAASARSAAAPHPATSPAGRPR